MSAVQFGIVLCYNLSVGTITPPVGTILFTGCKVGGVTIESVITVSYTHLDVYKRQVYFVGKLIIHQSVLYDIFFLKVVKSYNVLYFWLRCRSFSAYHWIIWFWGGSSLGIGSGASFIPS